MCICLRSSLRKWFGWIIVFIFIILIHSKYQKAKIKKQNPSIKPGVSTNMSNIVRQNYISELLSKERIFINENLSKYPTLKIANLYKNIMEKGGRPITSLLVSSWRSGSSFVGQILSSHPVTYYNYEPLHQYGLVQLRYGPDAENAVGLISDILHCDYSSLDMFLAYMRTQTSWCYSQNTRLWSSCTQGGVNGTGSQAVCFQSQFAAQFCKLFPFQAMKTVRLRLHLTETVVQDQSLDVSVVLLVRDPRAVLESRKRNKEIFNCTECNDPKVLCSDMLADFMAAKNLMKKYPRKYRMLRYEDLVMDPLKVSEELFEFYKIPFHRDVIQFILNNSQETRFRWIKALPMKEILEIQEKCADALDLWGYNLILESDDLDNVETIGKFEI